MIRSLVISDFNVSNFLGYIRHDSEQPPIECCEAPFGQVMQVLADPRHPSWESQPDFAVLWTQPNGVIQSFEQFQCGEAVSLGQILEEVEAFASLVLQAQERTRFTFVPSWTLPPYEMGSSWMSMSPGGIGHTLACMNGKLAECFGSSLNIHMLDVSPWISQAGKAGFNPKYWYMSKVPFGPAVFKAAMHDIKSAYKGLTGGMKKMIVLDLDDTLWGGIVGDVGWEYLTIGGHDPKGEAYVHFQQALKTLVKRGVLLAIVSKNEESIALEAIQNHPEMVLNLKDFVGW